MAADIFSVDERGIHFQKLNVSIHFTTFLQIVFFFFFFFHFVQHNDWGKKCEISRIEMKIKNYLLADCNFVVSFPC
jgi:hypothetical protein